MCSQMLDDVVKMKLNRKVLKIPYVNCCHFEVPTSFFLYWDL